MFTNRIEAGRQLGLRLKDWRGDDVVVLGLPRGGVPVAAEVAQALDAPLDVIIVRKLGVPSQPELAMGAIGEENVRVLDQTMIRRAGISPAEVQSIESRELVQLADRIRTLRQGRVPTDLRNKTAIIVDDGIATGATTRAACAVARRRGAARIVLAVPVAPRSAERELREADQLVTVESRADFGAVGYHYRDFTPVSDEQVSTILALRDQA